VGQPVEDGDPEVGAHAVAAGRGRVWVLKNNC
jgi:hypothetical protein